MPETSSPSSPSLLSRRLRRWQDAREFTNQTAADFFGISLRTYTNALLDEHLPRGLGRVSMERTLDEEEHALRLPPMETPEA